MVSFIVTVSPEGTIELPLEVLTYLEVDDESEVEAVLMPESKVCLVGPFGRMAVLMRRAAAIEACEPAT